MTDTTIDLGVLSPSRFDRIVAAEPNADGTATLYRREPDGTLTVHTTPFRPWFLVQGSDLAQAIPGASECVALSGAGEFNCLVRFANTDAYDAGIDALRERTGFTPGAAQAPYRVFTDRQQQLFTAEPLRLFRGLTFGDLRRLQLDIETRTSPGYDFCNADRADDAIILIALRDSTGWETCLSARDLSEEQMLRQMVQIIRDRDPDVIEGHNLVGFDLPYIVARARRCRVPLRFARDGGAMTSRASRFTAGERTVSYTRFDVRGRHLIDTYQLVQLYDISHRDLESFGLKSVARHFGIAAPERTYVAPEEITATFDRDPALLGAYALDDVRETEALSRILSPSYFYQAQIIPYSFQNCVVRGTGTRIDALLTAAYLHGGTALPKPEPARPFRGALTEAMKSGVFANVWHVDVASLYPSVMVSFDLVPRRDDRREFPRFLTELRKFRLLAKENARRSATSGEREHYDALQSSFKVLINSFYGYVGFAQATFNDYEMAEAVTAKGRDILTCMLEFLERERAVVIEMDTDGVYFVPPPGVIEPTQILARLQQELPAGIDVDLDSTYAAMFSYKSKNYALLDHDGRVAMTGAALKSRGLEPFQRRCIHELVTLLLTGKGEAAAALFDRYAEAIREHRLPLTDLAQREVLSTSPRAYKEKLEKGETRRSAAYELALSSGRTYEQGDAVAFYLTGNRRNVAVTDAAKLLSAAVPGERDENVPYYLDKLEKLREKFAEFLPPPGQAELTLQG